MKGLMALVGVAVLVFVGWYGYVTYHKPTPLEVFRQYEASTKSKVPPGEFVSGRYVDNSGGYDEYEVKTDLGGQVWDLKILVRRGKAVKVIAEDTLNVWAR